MFATPEPPSESMNESMAFSDVSKSQLEYDQLAATSGDWVGARRVWIVYRAVHLGLMHLM